MKKKEAHEKGIKVNLKRQVLHSSNFIFKYQFYKVSHTLKMYK